MLGKREPRSSKSDVGVPYEWVDVSTNIAWTVAFDKGKDGFKGECWPEAAGLTLANFRRPGRCHAIPSAVMRRNSHRRRSRANRSRQQDAVRLSLE